MEDVIRDAESELVPDMIDEAKRHLLIMMEDLAPHAFWHREEVLPTEGKG